MQDFSHQHYHFTSLQKLQFRNLNESSFEADSLSDPHHDIAWLFPDMRPQLTPTEKPAHNCCSNQMNQKQHPMIYYYVPHIQLRRVLGLGFLHSPRIPLYSMGELKKKTHSETWNHLPVDGGPVLVDGTKTSMLLHQHSSACHFLILPPLVGVNHRQIQFQGSKTN